MRTNDKPQGNLCFPTGGVNEKYSDLNDWNTLSKVEDVLAEELRVRGVSGTDSLILVGLLILNQLEQIETRGSDISVRIDYLGEVLLEAMREQTDLQRENHKLLQAIAANTRNA